MPETNPETLTILYTNDIHSHFETMGPIAAMVDQERSDAPGEVLLLDIGDHMDRAAMETEGTMGKANVEVINLMGYDAITIGNNEGLTFTPAQIKQAYADLHSPVVCGNIVDKETGNFPEWMKRSLILSKGGIKIGLVAATAAFAEFYELMGLTSLNPLETIARDVRELRDQVDLVVVMSHLGLPMDRELAERTAGIDIIIGGHTHHLLEVPLLVGDTTITAAGKFGAYLGKLVIRPAEAQGGRLSFVIEGQCLPVKLGNSAKRIDEALAMQQTRARQHLTHAIAVTNRELPLQYSVESPFGNLLAQAVRRYTGSDLSLVNSGQLLAGLPAGTISEGMLHERCPSPINPCTMKLSGRDILYSLEESLLEDMVSKEIKGYGFRGKVLGGLCVDGLEVSYAPQAAPYQRITQVMLDGVPIRPEQAYTVGTLDMFSFGIGYERLQHGTEKRYMLPDFLRDLLRMELQIPGATETCFHLRWKKVEY
ncbi:bifunctional metallophosphatase/5'-nucleotidase [Paenibacillus sanguinis]|uniref:bifunctional metallophosphatase/5'-nucleotidase n=1 Tax=Paenibacillus sanguinis TaxID=225906 RepID=UPI00037E165C|nr:bifunctional UDP-sugar hydrolase/5'-nucleotidase [Paenibacillus sanguinis]